MQIDSKEELFTVLNDITTRDSDIMACIRYSMKSDIGRKNSKISSKIAQKLKKKHQEHARERHIF